MKFLLIDAKAKTAKVEDYKGLQPGSDRYTVRLVRNFTSGGRRCVANAIGLFHLICQ